MTTDKPPKILLALMPFWEPQIPPLGIVSLKTFLGGHGYDVKTADFNVEPAFREIQRRYFSTLEELVPPDKRGNFPNLAQDVMRNHMIAHIHYGDKGAYLDLVKELVDKTFYTQIDTTAASRLTGELDEFFSILKERLTDLLRTEGPTLLGLSVYRGNLAASLFAFQLTREHFPHIENVMGGAIFAAELAVGSDNLDYFLAHHADPIDAMIAGEGELLFLHYLQGKLDKSKKVFTLRDLDGATLDLDTSAAVPDFSDLNLDFYPNLATSASRSCPFQCSFCTETVYWGKYRKKRTDRVVAEMSELHRRHGSQLFLLCDSLLNRIVTDLSRVLIESGRSLYWDGYLRVEKEVCSLDNTLLWRRGGFYRARLGIESGSPRVLALMDKRITLEQIKSALTNLAEAGIKTTTYWVIGHPGETEEDFLQTLDLIAEMKDCIYEAWCSPFNYYKTGQVYSGQWEEKSRLLYSPQARDMLPIQTWTLEIEPFRREAYERVNRFVDHCKKQGVPNPYMLVDFYRADERWRSLHQNAVPSLVEFEDKRVVIDEHKYVKKTVTARQKLNTQMDFEF